MENDDKQRFIQDRLQRVKIARQVAFRPDVVERIASRAQAALINEIGQIVNLPQTRDGIVRTFRENAGNTAMDRHKTLRFVLYNFMRGVTESRYKTLAEAALNDNTMEMYIFWYDAYEGAASIFSHALRAEEQTVGKEGEAIVDSILLSQEMLGVQFSMPEQIEAYKELTMTNDRLKQLLHDDPRGLSVVDYALERVKEIDDSEPDSSVIPMVPEFVIVGAIAARTAYREGYEILHEEI